MDRATVDRLLVQRQARRVGRTGSPKLARGRLHLNQSLWRNYTAFARMRNALNSSVIRIHRPSTGQRRLLRQLVTAGVLIDKDDHYRYRSNAARRYLTGGWLEELAYCAILDADADEAYYAQEIGWSVDGTEGRNEIDVLARRKDTLSFVSCKTASPLYTGKRRSYEKIEQSIFEAHYWDAHFADGNGRAVILISTDLYDEERSRPRSETLFARARVLEVDLLGRDLFDWNELVNAFREHW